MRSYRIVTGFKGQLRGTRAADVRAALSELGLPEDGVASDAAGRRYALIR